jgi:hypothetical protein
MTIQCDKPCSNRIVSVINKHQRNDVIRTSKTTFRKKMYTRLEYIILFLFISVREEKPPTKISSNFKGTI